MRKGRFYIFPALIPLAEILPWVLTGIGFLFGIVHPQKDSFFFRYKRHLQVLALSFLVAAGGIVGWQYMKRPPDETGTQLTAQNKWPAFTATLNGTETTRLASQTFTEVLSQPLPHEPLSPPVAYKDTLLIGTFGNSLDAFSINNGKHLWTLQKSEPIYSDVVITGDVAYVTEGLHTAPVSAITAFDLINKKVLWDRQFIGHLESPPRIDGQRIFLCSGPNGLWALSTKDGSVLWHQPLGHIDATPLLINNIVYAPAQPDESKMESKLFALDADSGKILHTTDLPGHPMGSPSLGLSNKQVLLTSAIGQVGPKKDSDKGWAHAVDTDSGKLLWSVELTDKLIPESPVLQKEGLVFNTLQSGEINALSMIDGKSAWVYRMGDDVNAPAGLTTETAIPLLAVISKKGNVAILDARNGKEMKHFQLESGDYSPPFFKDDTLYIFTAKKLHAFYPVHTLIQP